MIYAEIKSDGTIHQVWEGIGGDAFSPPLLPGSKLVSFPDGIDVRPGMRWDGKQLLPPPPPPLEQVKASAKQDVVRFADDIGQSLTAEYPASERATWPFKVQAARAYVAGTADAEAKLLIEDEALIAGKDPMMLAQSIVANYAWFIKVGKTMSGMRQKAFAAIDAAPDAAAVQQVLTQMRAEAETALAALMAERP